jgi:hypothetical protein
VKWKGAQTKVTEPTLFKTILTFERRSLLHHIFNYSWTAVMILDLVANISNPIQLIALLSVPVFS